MSISVNDGFRINVGSPGVAVSVGGSGKSVLVDVGEPAPVNIKTGPPGIPPGGEFGQALTKSSDADYAVGWAAVVGALGVTGMWAGTRAAYDAIPAKSPTTLYVIVP